MEDANFSFQYVFVLPSCVLSITAERVERERKTETFEEGERKREEEKEREKHREREGETTSCLHLSVPAWDAV